MARPAPLEQRPGALEGRSQQSDRRFPMTALAIIFGFIIVLGALNVFEFGRID